MSWALRSDLTGRLTSTERLVLVTLADAASTNGKGTWLSKNTIAERLGISREAVKRAMRSLEDKGAIMRGDQKRVEYIPAYARPVVWDLPVGRRLNPVECDPDDDNDQPRSKPLPGVTDDPGSRKHPGSSGYRARGHLATERGVTNDPQTKNRTSIEPSSPVVPSRSTAPGDKLRAPDCPHGTPNGTWTGIDGQHPPGWKLCPACRRGIPATDTDPEDDTP